MHHMDTHVDEEVSEKRWGNMIKDHLCEGNIARVRNTTGKSGQRPKDRQEIGFYTACHH